MSNTAKWVTGIVILIVLALLWYFLDHRNLQLTPTDVAVTATTTPATASPAPAATATSTAPAVTPTTNQPVKNFMHQITIKTNKGTIVFETYDADAPKASNNFVTLANKGFYNNLTFHRIIKGFMIQGGDPVGNGTGGPGYQFADELDSATASYKAGYVRGAVAMANSGPNTNGSQFFIMHQNYALPHSYTIFGRVVSGMDVVDAIASTPTGANDKPVSPVIMEKVSVTTK